MLQAQYSPKPTSPKYISLTLDSDLPCICIQLRGPVSGVSLQEVHQQALQGLASGPENHAPKNQLLCDLSGLETFTFPDQQWFIRQWLPQAPRAGFRAVALVMPAGTVSWTEARSVRVLMEVHGISVLVTGEFTQAQQWLQSLGEVTRQ